MLGVGCVCPCDSVVSDLGDLRSLGRSEGAEQRLLMYWVFFPRPSSYILLLYYTGDTSGMYLLSVLDTGFEKTTVGIL